MRYVERIKDVITGDDDLEDLHCLTGFPVFMGSVETERVDDLSFDMEWSISKSSGVIQLKKLLPLDVLYQSQTTTSAVGALWMEHHRAFAEFVGRYAPKAVLELGGAHGILAKEYERIDKVSWTILEPNPAPVSGSNARFIKGFFDDKFRLGAPIDTVIHSHVYEHLYEPDRFTQHLADFLTDGQRMIFAVPHLRSWLEKKYTNCINFEHTVFLTEPYIEYLLSKHGFRVEKKEYFRTDHSIFYACVRDRTITPNDFKIIDKISSRSFQGHVLLADVRCLEDLRKVVRENSALINLAAEHRDDVQPCSLYDEVNVDGARNVSIVVREKDVKTIVFTSSVAVYGFAPLGTDESGRINPFNDYGRTKYEAEQIYKEWQAEAPDERTLVIIRPTVVFGERNRGNVFNLLRQIASGRFVMVGDGQNRKSMAYVENVAAFIEYGMTFKPGVHIYNYIDKPDFTMNTLVSKVNRILGRSDRVGFRLPFSVGLAIGKCFDLVAKLTGKRFAISAIRVKKFCANSVYNTAIAQTGFVPPVPLEQALEQTIRYEFMEDHGEEGVFYSE